MKKFLKKTLAVTMAAAISLTVCSTSFAQTFSDVTEENYPWAYEAIENMAEDGIIKGYEDGSFGPAKTVTKLESLVMISRILGFNDSANDRLIESAGAVFYDELESLDLPYGTEEISYLLMKGILSVDELENYVDDVNRSEGLKRYEVATLLTKALDAEGNLSSDAISEMTYSDVSDIPASAKKYVAYVSQIGLMQGMESNVFAPNDTVTRAQAAVVLYKLQLKTDYEFKNGVVAMVDPVTRSFKMKSDDGETVSHSLNSGIIYRYNGNLITVNDIEVGNDCVITYKNGNIYAMDFTDALVDKVVYGCYAGMAKSNSKGTSINVYVLDDTDTDVSTDKKETFSLSDDCVITYNGNTCSVSSLKKDYYVKLTVKKGFVTLIEAENKTSKVTGRINEVVIDPIYKLIIEDNNGKTAEYLVSSDVTVNKNGSSSNARELLAGDSVSLTLEYGRITAVSATSKSSTKTGILKEMVISATPRITITSGDEDITYFVSNDATIKLNGTEGTFYGLRVGNAITLKLESDTVVSIETTAASGEVMILDGIVKLVNSSYGLVQMEFVDSQTGTTRTESVLIKSNASIVDYKTQKTKKISDIKVGARISVTGSIESGMFEAGNVVIIG